MMRMLLVAALLAGTALGQQDSARITLERLYGSSDFATRDFGPVRWPEDGLGYTTLERTSDGGREIVRYNPSSGKRDVLETLYRAN